MANENDDVLDPAEIEALLNSAGGAVPQLSGQLPGQLPGQLSGPSAAPTAGEPVDTGRAAAGRTAAATANQPVTHGDIDDLLKEHRRGATAGNPEALLESAAANLAAAIAPDSGLFGDIDPAGGARPFEFQPFDRPTASETLTDLSNLKDVELNLRIELGRTELLIEEVLKLREGSVVALDKLAGDPVDILVNGRLVARGEVLVLNDNFCVRVAEILAPALM